MGVKGLSLGTFKTQIKMSLPDITPGVKGYAIKNNNKRQFVRQLCMTLSTFHPFSS